MCGDAEVHKGCYDCGRHHHARVRTTIAIYRAYAAIALLWAVAGMLLGLYTGITEDNTLLQMHVAIMLSGFATLAIYWIVYRLWPAFKNSPLAPVQFWVAIAGATGIGSYFFATSGSIPLIATASVVFVIAAAMMAWLFLTNSRA
jgi:hypothetical protein